MGCTGKKLLKRILPFYPERIQRGSETAKSDGVEFVTLKPIMKPFAFYWALFFLMACNKENAPDCFQNAGEIVRREVVVPDFDKITAFENVNLIVKQGGIQKVEIETGEFLFDEVSATVDGDRLMLRNANGCNLFREYGLTKIYVTSPNIVEIRSSTGLPIQSDGVLSYPEVALLSESFNNPEAQTTDGEFNMEFDSRQISIVVNGIAYFKIRGKTENLNLVVAAGDSRIEAENLVAQKVNLNHRGSNDMLVDPQQSIKGVIRGTGDVVSFNRPPEIDVSEIYDGRLVFE